MKRSLPAKLSIIIVLLSTIFTFITLSFVINHFLSTHKSNGSNGAENQTLQQDRNSLVVENAVKVTANISAANHIPTDTIINRLVEKNTEIKPAPKPISRFNVQQTDKFHYPGKYFCPLNISEDYGKISDKDKESFAGRYKQCEILKSQHRVIVGKSWGTLPKHGQQQWDNNQCNELLQLGKSVPCSEKFGWKYMENWIANKFDVIKYNQPTDGTSPSTDNNISALSQIQCYVEPIKSTSYCDMRKVMVDFSKMEVHHNSGTRSFHSGFLNIFTDAKNEQNLVLNTGKMPSYPGMKIVPIYSDSDVQCDEHIDTPVFVLSNDDIYNLGHYINDVISIWNMLIFSAAINQGKAGEKVSKHRYFYPENSDSQSTTAMFNRNNLLLINIDGLREGGPAGGPSHRLMERSNPDFHGPYSELYFHKWFKRNFDSDGNVKRAVDFKEKKVCFDNIYLFPLPGLPWFWNDWGRVNECAREAASPLYQSFARYLSDHLRDHSASKNDDEDNTVHIVIERRMINHQKKNKHSSARFIRNVDDLKENLLRALSDQYKRQKVNIKVTVQDFASLNFQQQVQLAKSASILISMHGAGTTHIFHMDIGMRKYCCGLIELFPDHSIEFFTAHGYENLAKMLGLHHERVVAENGQTTVHGTNVNVAEIVSAAKTMIDRIIKQPTCLHDVVYGFNWNMYTSN